MLAFSRFTSSSFLLTALAFALTPVARADPGINIANSGLTSGATFPVSSSDLLQTNLSSASFTGSLNSFTSGASVTRLYDGVFGTAGNSDYASSIAFTSGSAVTFNFNTTISPAGYSLSSISTYASWDSGRDGQEYTVSYSLIGSPTTFVDLVSVPQFNPVGGQSTLVTLTQSGGGNFLTGVAALRFTFTGFENNGTAFREIDVLGSTTTTVPEPSTYAAIAGALALGGTILYRRRAAKS